MSDDKKKKGGRFGSMISSAKNITAKKGGKKDDNNSGDSALQRRDSQSFNSPSTPERKPSDAPSYDGTQSGGIDRSNYRMSATILGGVDKPAMVSLDQVNPDDNWITVWGFPPTQVGGGLSYQPLVLSQFNKVGKITHQAEASIQCNWLHLKFSSSDDVEQALELNGKVMGNNLILGVKRAEVKGVNESITSILNTKKGGSSVIGVVGNDSESSDKHHSNTNSEQNTSPAPSPKTTSPLLAVNAPAAYVPPPSASVQSNNSPSSNTTVTTTTTSPKTTPPHEVPPPEAPENVPSPIVSPGRGVPIDIPPPINDTPKSTPRAPIRPQSGLDDFGGAQLPPKVEPEQKPVQEKQPEPVHVAPEPEPEPEPKPDQPTPVEPTPEPAAVTPAAPPRELRVALWDFAGDEAEGQAVFVAGEVIRIVPSEAPEGWALGDVRGKEGYFPINFTELYDATKHGALVT